MSRIMSTVIFSREVKTVNAIMRQLKRIRLVYRQSSTATRALVLGVVVVAAAALLTLRLTIGATQDQKDALADQAADLEQGNQELREDIDELGTANSVVELAQKLWELVFPGTVVIDPE